MPVDRRTALQLAGLGVGTAVAGCLDLGDGSDGDDGSAESPTGPMETPSDPTDAPADPDADTAIADHATTPLAVRSSAPAWYRNDESAVGHAVVVDSKRRERPVLGRYDLPGERESSVEEFLADVDYDAGRVVLVESAGPDGCHGELSIENVELVDDGRRLGADVTVPDDSEAATGCTQALVFPSVLLRVGFDGPPVDAVALEVTDGWGETATVTASADDPLPSPDPGALPGYVRPDAEADPVAARSCDGEGLRRHDQWFEESDVHWGDFEDQREGEDADVVLSLRVDDLSFEYGETARITLTNVTDGEAHTGNRAKYTLQVYTEDGWQDVRVMDEDGHFGYTDEAVAHQPGEGFEWTFELTEAGIVDGAYHDDARVCPDLQSGRYRFAYFGVLGDGAVAVSFDLSV